MMLHQQRSPRKQRPKRRHPLKTERKLSNSHLPLKTGRMGMEAATNLKAFGLCIPPLGGQLHCSF